MVNQNFSHRTYTSCPKHCQTCTHCIKQSEDNRFNDRDHNIGGSIDTVYICDIINDYCPTQERFCPQIQRSRETLTSIQYEIIENIKFFYEKEGYPPTAEELAYEFNITSSAILFHLKQLMEKGYMIKKNKKLVLADYRVRLEKK